MHRTNEPLVVRILFDLPAQPGDEVVYGAGRRRLAVAPDRAKEFVARDDSACALGQVLKDGKLS